MTSRIVVNNIQADVGVSTVTFGSNISGNFVGNISVSGVTTVAAGSTSAPSITPTGDSNTGIFFPSADTIAFAEGGTEALRINSSSFVGIGTINPGFQLTVDQGTSDGTIFDLKNEEVRLNVAILGSGSVFPRTATINSTRVDGGTHPKLRVAGQGGIEFAVDLNTVRATIDSSGNLGIGTTNPLARLSVGSGSIGDVNVPIQISTQSSNGLAYYGANNNGSYGALFGYDKSSYSGLVIRSVGASDNIEFLVNNTTRAATITSGGNVGVGITNPSQKLEVTGRTVITTGIAPFYGLKVLDYTNTTGVYVGSVSGGNAWYIGDAYYFNSNLWRTDKTAASYINFKNGATEFYGNTGLTASTDYTPTVRFQINPSGNVTINNGNLAFSTAGTGIDFSANANAAGMTSELLDDYETGTWTPNQGAGLTVSGTFSSSGTYTKIGRLVFITFTLTGSSGITIGNAGTGITSNLPFTATGYFGVIYVGTSNIGFGIAGGNAATVYSGGNVTGNNTITFSATYYIS